MPRSSTGSSTETSTPSATPPRGAARSALSLAGLLALGAACRPSLSSFYDRVFDCDSTVAASTCGTDQNGAPMKCFAASQLGASDFCADSCDGDVASSSTAASVCLESKASLTRCHPSADLAAGGSECPRPLRCYRTDLLTDDGVCTTFNVCSAQADCTDSVRTTCSSAVLETLYPHATSLQLDNLYCVQVGCQAQDSSCGANEACLPDVLPPASRPFDVCVPKCDADLDCPPDFFCLRKTSGPANPAVCIPGLLGFRCETSNDCMLGECVATGEGFNVCTIPCSSDDECAPLRGSRGVMRCLAPTAQSPTYCMMAESFSGATCLTDSDCGAGERCTFYSPFGTTTQQTGSCLLPCAADGTCRPRGGVPHSCLHAPALTQPTCYPGEFSIACATDAACFADLKCLPSETLLSDDTTEAADRCTRACASNADCTADALSYTSDGWCEQGVCVAGRSGDVRCTDDWQCASGSCAPSTRAAEVGTGVLRCTFRPGEAP